MSRSRFLDMDSLENGLTTTVFGRTEIDYLLTTGSTNDVAREQAEKGAPEGTLVIAEYQSRGRGRLGRFWHSPPGSGLYFSIVLRPRIDPTFFPRITLLAGVAVAEAIEETTALQPHIKWPNDLLLQGKKVAGILTELYGDITSPRIILGVGINVHTRPEDFPPALQQSATSLTGAGAHNVSRLKLLQALLGRLEHWYGRHEQGESTAMLEAWRRRCPMIGRRAAILSGPAEIVGKIIDVDDDGCLLVEDEAGQVQRILSGEITRAITP